MNFHDLVANFRRPDLPDPRPRTFALAIVACLAMLGFMFAGVRALAHDEPDCAGDPPIDVLAVHYKVPLADAKSVFESRGFVVRTIGVYTASVNCNDGRTEVWDAWKACHTRFYHFVGNYDATLGESCRVYKMQADYTRQLPTHGGYID